MRTGLLRPSVTSSEEQTQAGTFDKAADGVGGKATLDPPLPVEPLRVGLARRKWERSRWDRQLSVRGIRDTSPVGNAVKLYYYFFNVPKL